MVEWHITPDYIMNNWTDELFVLMCEKLVERKQREKAIAEGEPGTKTVSDEKLFSAMGVKVKKHGD